jgi:hypothetical protein
MSVGTPATGLSARRWVAFIRAINGAPTNRIKMVDLARLLGDAGCADVSWHIQTGNMFLAADAHVERDALAQRIEARLFDAGLRRADVMLRTSNELVTLVANAAALADIDTDQWMPTVSFFRRPPADPDTSWFVEHGCDIVHLDDWSIAAALPRTDALKGGYGTIEKRWKVSATGRWYPVVAAVAQRAAALDGNQPG